MTSHPDRLYYTDAYLRDFSSEVLRVDGTRVTLAATAFYPTSGGQPFDTGTLNGMRVVDVIDEDDHIIHVLDRAPSLAVGDTVKGVIDWPRRWDHMQQHTGQHLLSAVFADLFGHQTLSVHFGD